jgi:VWFA-related protein
MPYRLQFPFARRLVRILLACGFSLCAESLTAQSPAPPATQETTSSPQAPAAQKPAPAADTASAAAAQNSSSEVSSRDTPATFKVRVNLVLVRVVVRDAQGHVVPGLKKEDFQIFDNRKAQVVSSFSVETPETHAPISTGAKLTTTSTHPDEAPAEPSVVLPQRFVALLFDDAHLSLEDSTFVRSAGTRLFSALAPSDRVGIYTTSGQMTQEYTDDRELLNKALFGIVPRPVTASPGFHDCPEVNYYQADLIENKQDTQAMAVATEDAVQCAFNGDHRQLAAAQSLAQTSAIRALNQGDIETEHTYRHLEDTMRRLAAMPGQRVLLFISPGFVITTLQLESSDIITRANRANIVINTIDARGLYTPDFGNIADPPRDSLQTAGFKSSYRVASQSAQAQILGELADGTGGTFFHNRNDVDEGLRLAAAAPPISYLLSFSPQNLKVDGRYHTLKVTLTNKQKFSIQARHGYYAPRTVRDPAETAKQEIQEAIFSQEEMRDLPIDLQTQFFKKDQSDARISVLTHVDLRGMHFRKAEGRNHNNLTLATAIFDENGNFITGGEKVIEMRLLDPTYDRLSRSGFTVKSSFDVKPGTYLVRQVVRDEEGSQMAARNGAVVIPY